jgi:hypothetical protein
VIARKTPRAGRSSEQCGSVRPTGAGDVVADRPDTLPICREWVKDVSITDRPIVLTERRRDGRDRKFRIP